MPLLNMSMNEVIGQKLSEPFSQLHAKLYVATVKGNSALAAKWIATHPEEITEYSGYEKIIKFFKEGILSKKVRHAI